MKYKLEKADYIPETGISQAMVSTKRGNFFGYAQCHPEEEFPSHYAGCRLAESRALLKAVQFEKNMINVKIQELKNFEKILKSLKDYNPHSVEARRLRRRIHELKEERLKYLNFIIDIKEGIRATMDKRDAYLAKKAK